MPPSAQFPRPGFPHPIVLWSLFYLAPISGVRAQSLSLNLYIDSYPYVSGTVLSCRPGASLFFQCEYWGLDQTVATPFPPNLCFLSSPGASCAVLRQSSSPSPPWPSGKLRSNYTIPGATSGTRYFSCQYTSPQVASSVTIVADNNTVYPANVNCVLSSSAPTTVTTSTTSASGPSTTGSTASGTTPTNPSTSSSSKSPTTPGGTTSKTSTSSRTALPATQAPEGLTDLNPLIYTVVGVFLLGVLAIVIIITCWIRARRIFNSRLISLRSTTSPFDYLDYISEGDLTPITTTEFIISMQQQRPPTYNQSQELEVLSTATNGTPPPLPPRNGTRPTDTEQAVPPVTTTAPDNSSTSTTTITRHPNDTISPEEVEQIESRINVFNRRLSRASRGRGRSRHTSQQSDTVTLLSNEDREESPPDLFEEPRTTSQSEGTQMSLLL